MSDRKYSLCLTNYNRDKELIESFAQVLNDARIDEVVISDDLSEMDIFADLVLFFADEPKVKFKRNIQNLGMSLNKVESLKAASNEWCILFDSDNIISPDYLNALDQIKLSPNHIYMPEFARPHFDYREFSGHEIATWKAQTLLDNSMFGCLLNTCNYVVHKHSYCEVFKINPAIKGTDTLWFNYLWLKGQNYFNVVPGLQYDHKVHNGSEWSRHATYNLQMGEQILQMIKEL